jgi:hypothetical protein
MYSMGYHSRVKNQQIRNFPKSHNLPSITIGYVKSLIHVDSKNMTDTIRYVKINYRVHNRPIKDPVEYIPHLNTSFLAIRFNSNLLSILRVPQHSSFRFPG